MNRIARKINNAPAILPQPDVTLANAGSNVGIVYFGANRAAVHEGMDLLSDH